MNEPKVNIELPKHEIKRIVNELTFCIKQKNKMREGKKYFTKMLKDDIESNKIIINKLNKAIKD